MSSVTHDYIFQIPSGWGQTQLGYSIATARKWNIMDKISCAVTDNANNIVAAIRIAGWSHLPCFAHTINLIVTNSISEVPELEELIKSCKDIVSYFHKSSKATSH